MVTQFRDMRGAVYILENPEAERVKVGMTINAVELRLRDANAMWLERKVTCQVCGARRYAKITYPQPRVVPQHSVAGAKCPGGSARPLEHDTILATEHLSDLKLRLDHLVGTEKASVARQIKKLEERLLLRDQHKRAVGKWNIATVYYTDCAERVELLSHEILEAYLDRSAPFGEVFSCPISKAREAVEQALLHLGLLGHERRDDPIRRSTLDEC